MSESPFHQNAVFFIETDKISPNPYQPRREFDEGKLNELSESIRMYGVLQPIVVTRKEVLKEDGGIAVEYELIAGERRHRASRLAGLRSVPALIRDKEDSDREKLEMAIIENLQREDISSIDRARAFKKLCEDFNLKHIDIAKKVGKSREYVSNTIRLLSLPDEMLQALSEKRITEGHTRPLLMLGDRPEEQNTLFKEIMLRRLTVRDAERISRRIAVDKVRRMDTLADPEVLEWEKEVGTKLGTRVHVEQNEKGGRVSISYFNKDDLKKIMDFIMSSEQEPAIEPDHNVLSAAGIQTASPESRIDLSAGEAGNPESETYTDEEMVSTPRYGDDSTSPDTEKEDEDLYSVSNFNI
jgi:ParB family transcriptional regulator, chromosome partitioning protein